MYSWIRLTWRVEEAVRVDCLLRTSPCSHCANCDLVSRCGLPKAFRERRCPRPEGLSLASSPRSRDPTLANRLGDGSGERGVRQEKPAPRRDTVGLVAKALGKHLRKIPDRPCAQELRVDRRHAIGAVRADDREVGHAHLSLCALFHKAHALDTPFVPGKAGSHGIEEASVDLEDDLEVARQELLEPCDRPFLEGFGKERVVRVGERSLGEVPGLVPTQVDFVEQHPHELGDDECRVCVVELDGDFFGKCVPVRVAAPEAPQEIGERRRRRGSTPARSAVPVPCWSSHRDTEPASGIRLSSVSARAPTKSPLLNSWKSKASGAAAAQSRSVLMVLPP